MSDLLADLTRRIERLNPEELKALDEAIGPEMLSAAWLPNDGPQSQAYHSKADLLLYGGAAGGGKTDLLVGLALTEHTRSVIFRRAFVDIRGIEERLIEVRGGREGYNSQDKVLRLGDGKLVEFGALEKPGAEFTWQGRPHDFLGFDEGAQLPEAKVRFVLGWARSTKEGQRVRAVIASNPPIGGEGDWLIVWFAPWLDPLFANPAVPGELRWCVTSPDGATEWVAGRGWYVVLKGGGHRDATDDEIALAKDGKGEALEALSRTYIPARLNDNPYLRNTNYRAQIQAMPEPLRTQLLEGDFLAGKQDAERQVVPSAWIEAAQERWKRGKPPGAKMLSLGVDVAQGGKDNTVLSPLYGSWFDELVVRKGQETPDGPSVAALVVQTMRNNCQVTIDVSGGYGGDARTQLRQMGKPTNGIGFGTQSTATTRDGTLGFLNMRAELWWRFREALDPSSGEDIALPPDRKLAAELAAPVWLMRGARILVESKDDIRKRLGASTDRADAVILAWHNREVALFQQSQGFEIGKAYQAEPVSDPFEWI